MADRKNMYSMCVATIVDVIGDRLRMRYDGLEDDVAEDFWCHYQSSEIHPIGWSSLVGHTLQPPIGKLGAEGHHVTPSTSGSSSTFHLCNSWNLDLLRIEFVRDVFLLESR